MCSPATAFLLGTMALFFYFCTFPSVFALFPLVQRQRNAESEWDQPLPGSIDGPEMKNDGGGTEELLASTYLVCCNMEESLIKKASYVCEGGISSPYYFH